MIEPAGIVRAASLVAVPGSAAALAPAAGAPAGAVPAWRRGFDGQRIADLGDGRFLNPLMAGDHPDPSILKDGKDYYMTFSTFDSYPGPVVWHSRDLLNWQPVTAALTKNVGAVWAPDICKHGDRYFIYFPAKASPNANYVI